MNVAESPPSAGEDIGTFARAFDRRSEPFDPWVVRATWDALLPYCGFPLRPADRVDVRNVATTWPARDA